MMNGAGYSHQGMYNMSIFGWLCPIVGAFILIMGLVVLILLAIYLYMKINDISSNRSKK